MAVCGVKARFFGSPPGIKKKTVVLGLFMELSMTHLPTHQWLCESIVDQIPLAIILGDRKGIVRLCFFQAEDGIRDTSVTGVQTCALPIQAEDGIRDTSVTGVQTCALPI